MHENRETSWLAAEQAGSPAGKGLGRSVRANGGEESDGVAVAMQQANKVAEQQAAVAESVEGRTPTKENTSQEHTPPAQDGPRVSQGLAGVRGVARARRQEKFTSLLHHLSLDLLRSSFRHLKKEAAPGVDGVRWAEYEEGCMGQGCMGQTEATPTKTLALGRSAPSQHRFYGVAVPFIAVYRRSGLCHCPTKPRCGRARGAPPGQADASALVPRCPRRPACPGAEKAGPKPRRGHRLRPRTRIFVGVASDCLNV